MNKILPLIAAVFAVVILGGCATEMTANAKQEEVFPIDHLMTSNYAVADNLIAESQYILSKEHPIIIATIVNIDNLGSSSTLGRLISEQVSARFTNSGFRMVEMKFQNSVYMKKSEGELMLTRQIAEIASSHNAQAVIVGTYAVGSTSVFVNLKIVQPETNIVLAASDYVIPLSRHTRSLLSKQR